MEKGEETGSTASSLEDLLESKAVEKEMDSEIYRLHQKEKDDAQKIKKEKKIIEQETPIGFYKTKTHINSYKVQLFPEHLPYDEFKRKRAFLFC